MTRLGAVFRPGFLVSTASRYRSGLGCGVFLSAAKQVVGRAKTS